MRQIIPRKTEKLVKLKCSTADIKKYLALCHLTNFCFLNLPLGSQLNCHLYQHKIQLHFALKPFDCCCRFRGVFPQIHIDHGRI